MRVIPTVLGAVFLGIGATTALGAPSLSDGTLSPSSWSRSGTASATWTQGDFDPGVAGPAILQVNTDPTGGTSGAWEDRGTVPGPLVSGASGFIGIPVGDLVGRHQVRVVIDGVTNSPFELGTLQLDRTAPTVSSITLTPQGGTIEADWIQSDDRAGTDPNQPVIVEVNSSATGGSDGAWVPFAEQPSPGDGRKLARTSLAGLPDGMHLVRALSRDRAGNDAELALGLVKADGTAPAVSAAVVGTPSTTTRIAELSYTADDGTGVGPATARPRVALVGRGDDADLAVPGESGPGRVLVKLPASGSFTVTLRLRDRVGNRGESAPVTIRVPGRARPGDALTGTLPVVGRRGGVSPGANVTWAYRQVRTFHARRGVRLKGTLRVARSRSGWRQLLGGAAADRYAGYADLRGTVLLGPAATAGIASIRGAQGGARSLSRADTEAAVMGLAVLLHETIHATGPVSRTDSLTTKSGLAFEEGFTEAATEDLLYVFVTSLNLPPAVRGPLAAAVRRRTHAYAPEVAFARRMSRLATKAPATSVKARAWRIRVADTWGAKRWDQLSDATGLSETVLRRQAAARTTRGALR
jgi:hypothetical protein